MAGMATNEGSSGREDVRSELRSAQQECSQLREENARLRAILGIGRPGSDTTSRAETALEGSSRTPVIASTPEDKIALFQRLFRGRQDVYAVRWEGKGGKSGYSPAAAMDWRAINTARPEERKRIARKTRILLSLTTEVIRQHLTGKHTVGIYPLLPDETC